MYLRITTAVLLLAACDGDGGSDAGMDASEVRTCQTYCDRIATACEPDFAQFSDEQACLSSCATLAEGQPTDTSGYTLNCRFYHLGEVEELGAGPHCEHAGPAGGDEEGCGTPCEAFCSLVQAVCTGADQQYPDMSGCMSACETIPNDVEYTADVTSGDSLACRVYHATLASTSADNAMQHCPHVAVVSDVCN